MQILLFDVAVWVTLIMAGLAAFSDWKTGLIQNRTVGLGALLGVLSQLLLVENLSASGLGLATLRVLGGVLLCSLVPLALYVAGGLGGGDVKLFMAIGACLGPLAGLEVQLLAFLLAMLFMVVQLALQKKLFGTLANSFRLLRNLFRARDTRTPLQPSELTMRLAPAIFAAALLLVVRDVVSP